MSKFMAVLNRKREISIKQKSMFKQIYFISLHIIIISLLIAWIFAINKPLSKENIERIAYKYAVERCIEVTKDKRGEFKCNDIEIKAEKNCSGFCLDELWNVSYKSSDIFENGNHVSGGFMVSIYGDKLTPEEVARW